MRRALIAAAGALALAWSVNGSAQDESARPQIVEALPEGVQAERVARIRCMSYAFTEPREENLERCRAELVGKAEARAGDYIVIESRQIGISFCNTCTRIDAGVYRVADEAAAAEGAAAEVVE